MAITAGPRSASDATRFTATTPQATSKSTAGPDAASTSRFTNPSSQPGSSGGRRPAGMASQTTETLEQRVARLRAAHLAAKNVQGTLFDRFVVRSRGFFDTAHKVTVAGLIGFTAIATLLTGYTIFDMLSYNRKRKAEFIAAQQRMAADSLAAARLAYMRNEATDEQMALVDEANQRESASREAGDKTGFFRVPGILGAPKALPGPYDDNDDGEYEGAGAVRAAATGVSGGGAAQGGGSAGTVAGLAKSAFEKEKENQRAGGPLDRLGLEADKKPAVAEKGRSRGWWPW